MILIIEEKNNILDTKQFKSVDRDIHKKYTRKNLFNYYRRCIKMKRGKSN
jgi:hypothetical protein